MTTIILTKNHTHAGVSYSAGKRLEVDDTTAEWLVAQGIARVKTPTATDADNTSNKDKTTHRKDPQS